jgi:peroxiredoxin
MARWLRTILPVGPENFLLACGVVLLLLAGGAAWPADRPASPSGSPAVSGEPGGLLERGAPAPAFLLPTAAGEEFSYGGEGKRPPLLLVFFSVFCDPCRAVLPVVQRIRAKYGSRGLEAACVSLDGRPLGKTVAAFALQEGYTFRVLLDEVDEHQRFRVADSYRVTEIPTVYLVDGEGRIALGRAGRIREEEFDKILQAVLSK